MNKPLYCPVCRTKFWVRDLLAQHLIKRHPDWVLNILDHILGILEL